MAPAFLMTSILAVVIASGGFGCCMAAAAPAAAPAAARALTMDAVDACLFTCDFCFKGDVVVRCANACIRTEAGMTYPWVQVCPYFYKRSPFGYYE